MTVSAANGTELLSLLASLIIVIGVIVVLGWLYSRSKLLGRGNSDVINVIATRALGSKERLMVVEIAGKQLLLGMTASQVQTLHVFDRPVIEANDVAAVSGFAGRLKTVLKEMRR